MLHCKLGAKRGAKKDEVYPANIGYRCSSRGVVGFSKRYLDRKIERKWFQHEKIERKRSQNEKNGPKMMAALRDVQRDVADPHLVEQTQCCHTAVNRVPPFNAWRERTAGKGRRPATQIQFKPHGPRYPVETVDRNIRT